MFLGLFLLHWIRLEEIILKSQLSCMPNSWSLISFELSVWTGNPSQFFWLGLTVIFQNDHCKYSSLPQGSSSVSFFFTVSRLYRLLFHPENRSHCRKCLQYQSLIETDTCPHPTLPFSPLLSQVFFLYLAAFILSNLVPPVILCSLNCFQSHLH